MQPYFLPYIGYFQLINAVDKFIVYDDVNYIKGGWINRNNIISNGKVHRFNIPLSHASPNRLICDIEVKDSEMWRKKLLQTIEFSYKKATCFNHVFELLNVIILSELTNISEININALKYICEYMGIKTPILRSSELNSENRHLRGQYRVVDICQKNGASVYINPYNGHFLYDKALFRSNNIELRLLRANPVDYSQNIDVFIPNLSIIDILMHVKKDKYSEQLDSYYLID